MLRLHLLRNGIYALFSGKSADGPMSVVLETDEVILDDVSLVRGKSEVLKQISLRLNEKRIGIIGNNGSGKSSLIKLINGLNLPDKGRVEVFGYDTRRHQEYLPAKVGFIFQNPDHQIIFPTVLEELVFGLEQLGKESSDAELVARDYLRQYRCESLADRAVHTLSEGQKQLVCILAILVMQPRLLLLDEPFSSLDLPTRTRLVSLLDESVERMILVSHDLETLSGLERVIWMHEGEVHRDGSACDTLDDYREYVAKSLEKERNLGELM